MAEAAADSTASTHNVRHYEVEADGEIPIKRTLDGPAAADPVTVMQRFRSIVDQFPDRHALGVKRDGAWQMWTYKAYYEDVQTAAKAMISLGLEPKHSVGIIGFNSPEWFIADLGAIFAGGFASGLYTTNKSDAVQYVANHSRSQIMVVEDDTQLQKVLEVKDQLPHLKAIVQYIGKVEESLKTAKIPVLEWAEFMRRGHDVADHELYQRIEAQKPGHCCTLIYTSGTTGTPKAVMISHDNITWTGDTLRNLVPLDFKPQNHVISFLPLSHIAAQLVDIHAPMACAGTTWFAQPDALKGSLPATLKEVRPTIFLGVPRVWEKIEEKMRMLGAQTTGTKKKISTWAKRKGLEGSYNKQNGKKMPSGHGVANALVFKKIRKALGLDRCIYMATAAAPIRKDTLDYFLSLNLPIMEVYGMSENSGPCTVSLNGRHRTGSTGKVFPGTELMIHTPDAEGNGEICMRGRHVFMGYLFNDEKTREAIDEDGWLHSGDIGRIDEDGFLHITGRIKELIITAGGENVAPVPIEDNIKGEVPFLSNVMVIGDKRKFLSCLVTLKVEVDPETTAPLDKLAPEALEALKSLGSSATTVAEARKDEKLLKAIEEGIARANKSAVSRAQCVQKFTILDNDFSVPGGELGPTLKLRRNIVDKMYVAEVDKMYT